MGTKKEEASSNTSPKEEKEKPSLVEKIVDSIHKDIINIIETIKDTEKS